MSTPDSSSAPEPDDPFIGIDFLERRPGDAEKEAEFLLRVKQEAERLRVRLSGAPSLQHHIKRAREQGKEEEFWMRLALSWAPANLSGPA